MKKLPLEPTGFLGEFLEFTHMAKIEPEKESFWGAFFYALFEAMGRLKEQFDLVARRVEEKWEGVRMLARKYLISKEFNDFLDVYQRGRSSLKNFLAEELERFDLNLIGKMLFIECVQKDEEKVMKGQVIHEVLLKTLCESLGIHIVVFGEGIYRLYSFTESGPVLFLYQKNESFSLVYHSSVKYLDEKGPIFNIDLKIFPFFHNPNMKLSFKLVKENDSIASIFLSICQVLVFNLHPLDQKSRLDILQQITEVQLICPEISEKLQDLSLKVKAYCNHKAKEFIFSCQQTHCIICLMDQILDSSSSRVLCPCGIELSNRDILLITGAPAKRATQKYLKPKNNPPSSLKLPNINRAAFCEICKETVAAHSQKGRISCPGHSLCLNCRASSIDRYAEECPICRRAYSNDEILTLKMINNSIDLTSSVFLQNSEII